MAVRSRKKKDKRKRKQLSAWDTFWIWVRRNEKIFWVILLVLISFSFAFTGPTTAFLRQFSQGGPARKFFGEQVSSSDYRNVLRTVIEVTRTRERAAYIYQYAFSPNLPEVYRRYFLGWTIFVVPDDRQGVGLSLEDYFLFSREADRLGIYVSDVELGSELRLLYWAFKAQDEAGTDKQAIADAINRLQQEQAFDVREWTRLLRLGRRPVTNPQVFEEHMRAYLRVEKAIDYIKKSAQVNMDDVYQRFLEQEQLRKFSFFTYTPDETVREKILQEITDDELEQYYDDNASQYGVFSPKLQFSYVYIPYEHFEKLYTPTEEDIEEHYKERRDEDYRQQGLDAGVSDFDLRTPEEEKELEKKLYVPLEEVRERVVESLIDTKTKTNASDVAAAIRKLLFPPKQGKIGDEPPDDDTDETAKDSGEDKSVVDQIKEEYPFVEVGTTRFFYQWEIDEKAGLGNSVQVSRWFSTVQANSREQDESKKKPIEVAKRHFTTADGSGLVFYPDVAVINPGEEEFVLLKEDVRDDLVNVKVLDAVKEEVDLLVRQIDDGEQTFEDAAKGLSAQVYASSYRSKREAKQIKIPDPDAEDEAAEEEPEGTEEESGDEADEAESGPQMKAFPGSYLVTQEAFGLEEEGDVGAARDETEGVYYAVRLDGRLAPAPEDFNADTIDDYTADALTSRQAFYLQRWREELWRRGQPQRFVYAP